MKVIFGVMVCVLLWSPFAFCESQSPSILLLANAPSEPSKAKLLAELANEKGLKLTTIFISGRDAEEVARQMMKYDMVMLDYVYMGQFMQMVKMYRKYLMRFPGVVFPGLMYKDPSLSKGLSREQALRFFQYFDNGGQENFRRMFSFIKSDVLKISTQAAQPPILFPEVGIYHPDAPQKVFSTLDEYLEWKAPAGDQPVIGVGFHRIRLSGDLTAHLDDLIHRLEAKGALPLAFYDPNEGEKTNPLLYRDGQLFVDTLVTFTGMYTSVDKQKHWLSSLDIPMVQANVWRTGYLSEWLEDEEGFPFPFVPSFFTLPEMVGRIDPTTVAVLRESDDRYVGIPEQMEALVERSLNYAKLRRMPNSQKKVAFLFWNSPPGEDNFSASFLNVPRSLENILRVMKDEGYTVDRAQEDFIIESVKKMLKPYYRTHDPAILQGLLDEDLAATIPVTEYVQWLETLPAHMQTAMRETWGSPNDTYLTITQDGEQVFVIPRLKVGNAILLPQPLRGDQRDKEKDIFHDKNVPVHHAYRAVYRYVVEHFLADAIVHVGTHGTQEWLPGKERGLWVNDDTQTTIGNVPVVYPYNVTNVGEALIAKRRGRAVVVSHNSPPFAPAGLYGDLVELHELIEQLPQLDEGKVKETTNQAIRDKVVALELHKDLGWEEAKMSEDMEGFLKVFHDYLDELASTAQPLGLHTFGSIAETDYILLTILQILGRDYIDAVEGVEEEGEFFSRQYDEILDTKSFRVLKDVALGKQPLESMKTSLHPFLEDARRHYGNFLAEQEIEHVLAALEGRYVPTGTGNDPLRNPDAVPTGRNVYGFDSRKIPTKAAWESGQLLAADLIENYRTRHGIYPDKLAFSLWSTETLKHFGVIEAEIFYLLGVRPVWNRRDQVIGVEVLPMKELQRPRIDVVLSLTGLYRDNLPGVMDRLSKAILKVAALKEENNFVSQNTERIEAMLVEKGIPADDASKFSRVRFFGNESGVYGTNLPDATLASDTWEDDTPMVDTYLSRMGYLFGTEAGTRNVKLDGLDLFAENLKGTKASVLSRSSYEHGVLSLDHPFEYLGGIGMAVRALDGTTPELFIANLRDSKKFVNNTVSDFVAKELRTRYYHPRWIEEMMKDGYSGANEILDVMNNFWGWNVMDQTSVRADQWQELFETYVQDKLDLGVDEWFQEVHPAALAQIAERMLEAVRKGYWEASEETVKALTETYLSLAQTNDIFTSNETFKEFVAVQAAGFGLDASVLSTPMDSSSAGQPPVPVEGMKLEKQEASAVEEDEWQTWYFALLLLLLVISGFVYEVVLRRISATSTVSSDSPLLGRG
ncbi:MAG: cobaltochelatase subunit CobN [Nitrospirales bacterium]